KFSAQIDTLFAVSAAQRQIDNKVSQRAGKSVRLCPLCEWNNLGEHHPHDCIRLVRCFLFDFLIIATRIDSLGRSGGEPVSERARESLASRIGHQPQLNWTGHSPNFASRRYRFEF